MPAARPWWHFSIIGGALAVCLYFAGLHFKNYVVPPELGRWEHRLFSLELKADGTAIVWSSPDLLTSSAAYPQSRGGSESVVMWRKESTLLYLIDPETRENIFVSRFDVSDDGQKMTLRDGFLPIELYRVKP